MASADSYVRRAGCALAGMGAGVMVFVVGPLVLGESGRVLASVALGITLVVLGVMLIAWLVDL